MHACMQAAVVYVTEFAKRGLIHASTLLTLRMCNSTSIRLTALNFGSKPFYLCTNRTDSFSLITCLQMKLCLVKVGKSDACIRPLFANSVTYMKC